MLGSQQRLRCRLWRWQWSLIAMQHERYFPKSSIVCKCTPFVPDKLNAFLFIFFWWRPYPWYWTIIFSLTKQFTNPSKLPLTTAYLGFGVDDNEIPWFEEALLGTGIALGLVNQVVYRNCLCGPTWLQINRNFCLSLIHLKIIFMCLLLVSPLKPTFCNQKQHQQFKSVTQK